MGFQALLPSGDLIAPAVDVLDGIVTAQQANDTYRGVTGTCPHCQELRDHQWGTDNAHVLAALSQADLSVRFKRAHIIDGRMVRIMHFAHRPGFLKTDGACLLCRNADLAQHAAAVKVIGRWAQKQWPTCTVKAEMQVVVPGAPPTTFRPDISIIDPTGRKLACIEYQRTRESFDAFVARDTARLQEFAEVLWFFHSSNYGRSHQHRDYLADRSRRFFKTWVDPETHALQCQDGERPVRRDRQAANQDLPKCSEQSLLKAINPPDRHRQEPLDINTSLELSLHQRSFAQPVAGFKTVAKVAARPIMTVTDRVKAAVHHGHRSAKEIQAWDSSFNQEPLQIGEIKRALKRIGG